MNNKILSVVLVLGIASTGFASLSSANDTNTGSSKSEMKQLFEKLQSGETLTAEEQMKLESAKEARGERRAEHGGKRKGGGNLTLEEKIQLQSMNDDEKKAFFDAKKSEMETQRTAHKNVIDKLIAGQTLTAAEEVTRLDMIAKISEKADSGKKREESDIISKVLMGDELTSDEQTDLEAMQAKHAEREAQRAIMEPIKAKLDAGETLSDEEQKVLDDHRAKKQKGKKDHGKGEKGEWK